MYQDLIAQISESVIKKAQEKVLHRFTVPLNSLLQAQELPLFKDQAASEPLNLKMGILALLSGKTSIPMETILSSIITNLILSRVIEGADLIEDLHITRKSSLNETIEIFLFEL